MRRLPDAAAYEQHEPGLLDRLIEVRQRLIERDLGQGIATDQWGSD